MLDDIGKSLFCNPEDVKIQEHPYCPVRFRKTGIKAETDTMLAKHGCPVTPDLRRKIMPCKLTAFQSVHERPQFAYHLTREIGYG